VAAKRKPRKTAKRATTRGPDPLAKLERELAAVRERQAVLFAALGLPEDARRGDRGTVRELNDAVLKIQDYLLRTSERIDHILGTLKNHRELLVKMNQRLYQAGTRERIRMELDIMKNTISILAMNGVEVDESLLPEIEKLKESSQKDDADIVALRKSKEKLDRRFDSEVRKLDLSTAYKPRDKDVPGYG